MREIIKNKISKLKNYWLGNVSVSKKYIYCSDWKESKRLIEVSIIPTKRGKGAWFSGVSATEIENIHAALNKNKTFTLHIQMGYGAYLEYSFNKWQQKLLSEQLEKLIRDEIIYIEEEGA